MSGESSPREGESSPTESRGALSRTAGSSDESSPGVGWSDVVLSKETSLDELLAVSSSGVAALSVPWYERSLTNSLRWPCTFESYVR